MAERRDMMILNLPGTELKYLIDNIHHDILVFRRVVSEAGHWIVSADQLGLWDIDSKGNVSAIYLPEAHKKIARGIIEKLFAEGGHWY